MFDPFWRRQALASLGQPFDLVVVGGGINGCGIAFDAAQRGLSVLVIEQADLASGTSSRSSKLIHGGLRYLRQLQLRTTRVSCRERDRQLALHPDLVVEQRFVYPVQIGDPVRGWQLELGLTLYDRLTAGVVRHRRVAEDELAERAPELARDGLDRTLIFRDARVDDARLTYAVAATAYAHGALFMTSARVEEGRPDAGGILRRLVIRDLEDGRTHEVEGRVLVSAAGVATDELRERCGLPGRRLRPSRGSHLVLRPDRLQLTAAVALPAADGRPIFVVPHPEGVLVGTTDLFHDGGLVDPRPTRAEADYLLSAVQRRFPAAHLTTQDVVGAFAGLRPILDEGAKTPSAASRDERIWVERGLLCAAGGKLTTWRVTAEESVDRALAMLPAGSRERAAPCATAGATLVGRAPRDLASRLEARGVEPLVALGLARRLRAAASLACELARSPHELAPVVPGVDLCLAEARAQLRFGAVLHLEDLLLRRTRLGMWQPEVAAEIAPRFETVAAEELGWDGARWDRELARLDRALEGWRSDRIGGIR